MYNIYMQIIITYFLSLPILILADYLFLGYLMKDYYQKLMSPAVTIQFNYFYAVLFYLLYLLGLFIFVIYPNTQSQNLFNTVLFGTLFGFFCYMTYDLTNIATVKDWPLKLIFVDIFWGAFVTGLISFIAYKIYFY